jgi:hypothetical protein
MFIVIVAVFPISIVTGFLTRYGPYFPITATMAFTNKRSLEPLEPLK